MLTVAERKLTLEQVLMIGVEINQARKEIDRAIKTTIGLLEPSDFVKHDPRRPYNFLRFEFGDEMEWHGFFFNKQVQLFVWENSRRLYSYQDGGADSIPELYVKSIRGSLADVLSGLDDAFPVLVERIEKLKEVPQRYMTIPGSHFVSATACQQPS